MSIDDIIIKPKTSNFLELLQQNIDNQNYQASNNINKPIKKYKPHKKKLINLTIPLKNEIKKYRYYTDNFKKIRKNNISNKEEKRLLKDNIEFNNDNIDEDNIKISKTLINYSLNEKYLDENQTQKKNKEKNINIISNNKNKEKNEINNKFNSMINNIEYNSYVKKIDKNKNLDFNISVENNSKINQINNKNCSNINITSSINNLNEFSTKYLDNINQSISDNNSSKKMPHEETMQNEINNILDLNNHINKKQINFNIIQNMKHSHSTKSFAFRKRIKPSNNSVLNNFVPEQIINKIEQKKNVLNIKNESKENNINTLQIKIDKLKEEYKIIKKEKSNYENLNRVIQSDIRNFNKQRKIEQDNFESYKNNEIKKLTNERNIVIYEAKKLNELKNKYIEINNENELNSFLNNQNILNSFRSQLEKANDKIIQLKNILKQLKINKKNNLFYLNDKTNNINNINIDEYDESEDNEDDNYDLFFPPKYHNVKYNLIKTEKNNDGKTTKIYDNNKIEIILNNGDKKEIYNNIYEITYFNNGNIKQVFKDSRKEIHFYNKKKIIKIILGKGLEIIKYDNGQIEKNFINGTKKISFPDGSLKYIFLNGLQETYYLDGSVERIDKEGNVILEHEDGTKELMYHFNKKIVN